MHSPKYSVIIPVYNRPEELREILLSLCEQSIADFEVLIVEDGSSQRSESVYEEFATRLSIQYFYKPNTGPGPSRNFGFEKARGKFFVVFDSDCVLPPTYFESVENYLAHTPLDAWGGPDRGHESFTALQRAMAFTMSSVMTTGGIRGGKNQAATFQPRSFNMGISRRVFEQTGGFKFERLAEDIELSVRMRQSGFRVGLIPEAFVFHKRRTTMKGFFKQVHGFGRGRVRVGKVHPGEVKVTHWFPAFFTMFLIGLALLWIFHGPLLWPLTFLLNFYLLAIFVDALRVTGSLPVAILSLPSGIVQLIGYGVGFLREMFRK